MSFKTPILCDRRIYDKKGKWRNPNQDIAEPIFYFVQTPRTLEASYDPNGREQLRETLTIVVFGGIRTSAFLHVIGVAWVIGIGRLTATACR